MHITRKISSALLIFALFTTAASCSAEQSQQQTEPNTTTQSQSKPPQESPKSTEENETSDPTDDFISRFNAIGPALISETQEFTPDDTSGPYYRTEYRTGAFSEAKGVHAIIDDASIDIVLYGSVLGFGSNDKLRVYADGPKETLKELYPQIAKTLDSSLSDEDIIAARDSEDSRDKLWASESNTLIIGDYYFGDQLMIDADLSNKD